MNRNQVDFELEDEELRTLGQLVAEAADGDRDAWLASLIAEQYELLQADRGRIPAETPPEVSRATREPSAVDECGKSSTDT